MCIDTHPAFKNENGVYSLLSRLARAVVTDVERPKLTFHG